MLGVGKAVKASKGGEISRPQGGLTGWGLRKWQLTGWQKFSCWFLFLWNPLAAAKLVLGGILLDAKWIYCPSCALFCSLNSFSGSACGFLLTSEEHGEGLTNHSPPVLVVYLFFIIAPSSPTPPPTPPHTVAKLGGGGYIGITVSICLCNQILSKQYFLNHSTFYNQTWYGNAARWGWMAVLYRRIGVLTSESRSQWGFI